MIKVRPAILEDMDWLLEQLKLFSSFYETKYPLFGEEDFVRNGLATMMTNHLVLVAEMFEPELLTGKKPVGFIAGLLVPHIFNPAINCLSETFWWVQPEFRNTRAGYLLIKEFVEYGKKNVNWILCTIEENSPINPDALLFRGFKLKERNYLMEVV